MTRNLVVITPPDGEPVDEDDLVKLHLRVDFDMDDPLIVNWITAAREKCEALTKRTFMTTGYELRLDNFPRGFRAGIYLPKPPAISVESVNYLDPAGVDTELDPANYTTDLGGKLPGIICPKWGTIFPACRWDLASVRVNYTAGYGDADAVPACAKTAILLLVAHWYRNREAVSEASMSEIPLGVRNVLRPLCWGHVP